MNPEDQLSHDPAADIDPTAPALPDQASDGDAPARSASNTGSYAETLLSIYADLPESLKARSQAIACCPKPFAFPEPLLDSAAFDPIRRLRGMIPTAASCR